jgi:Peptidase M15
MNLTEHFTLNEATFSQAADRSGIDNTPSPVVLKNIQHAAIQLERIRSLLNAPIRISSWYRNSATNKRVGGSKNSSHLRGFAIDFDSDSFGTPLQICNVIANSGIKFNQLIHEYGRWVHADFDPLAKMELLTIDSFGTRFDLLSIRK